MKLFRTIRLALKNIRGSKLRSALTVLGLVIGVSSVIVLVGIGTGTSDDVTSQVSSLGTDILTVSLGSDKELKLDQVDGLTKLGGVKSVAPYVSVGATVSKDGTDAGMTSVVGAEESYMAIRNYSLSSGRGISFIDVSNKSRVCVIGSDVKDDLFENGDALGQTVRIGGDNYTVIGVLAEQGSSLGTNADSMVLIPVTTAKALSGGDKIGSLYLQATDESAVDLVQMEAESYLRSTLDASGDEISVTTQESMLDTMSSIQGTLTLLLAGIAAISLVVGGIGVMNVMLVSVTERTREIGIRKSLGARRTDILVQFLTEALVLSLLGGATGVGAGIGLGETARTLGYSFVPSPAVAGVAFGFAALVGLVFGIFPAWRASRLNPIDALRQD